MTEDLARDLYRQFNKEELINIAKELELPHKNRQASTLVKYILEDVEKNGVPEADDCSDVALEFLLAAGYIDEEGNLLDDEYEPDEEVEDLEELSKTHECYTLADERDPACNRCKLLVICKQSRLDNRPECFGQLYDVNAEECKACIEAPFCSK